MHFDALGHKVDEALPDFVQAADPLYVVHRATGRLMLLSALPADAQIGEAPDWLMERFGMAGGKVVPARITDNGSLAAAVTFTAPMHDGTLMIDAGGRVAAVRVSAGEDPDAIAARAATALGRRASGPAVVFRGAAVTIAIRWA